MGRCRTPYSGNGDGIVESGETLLSDIVWDSATAVVSGMFALGGTLSHGSKGLVRKGVEVLHKVCPTLKMGKRIMIASLTHLTFTCSWRGARIIIVGCEVND